MTTCWCCKRPLGGLICRPFMEVPASMIGRPCHPRCACDWQTIHSLRSEQMRRGIVDQFIETALDAANQGAS